MEGIGPRHSASKCMQGDLKGAVIWDLGGGSSFTSSCFQIGKDVSIGRHCRWELAKEEEKNNSEDTSGKGLGCFVRKALAFIPCL